MAVYESYQHHGVEVKVRADLRGKHREYCLCRACSKLTPEPGGQQANCSTARILYSLCVADALVVAVWECPHFQEKKLS